MESQISCRSVAFSEEKYEYCERVWNGELDREGDLDRARATSAHRQTSMIFRGDTDLIGGRAGPHAVGGSVDPLH